MTDDQKPLTHKLLAASILNALFIKRAVTRQTIHQAREYEQRLGSEAPIWLRALAGGNPEQLDKLRAFVVEEFCISQLDALGYQVTLQKRGGK